MIFLKIDSIKGNSTIEAHKDQIEVESYSIGMAQNLTSNPANTDRTSGHPHFQDMSFNKVMDSSSPALYAACAGAKKLGTAVVTVVRIEGDSHMQTVVYNLGDAMIANVSTSGSSSGDLPMESFSINFTTITAQVTQQNADSTKKGVSPFGWDLKLGKPLAPPA